MANMSEALATNSKLVTSTSPDVNCTEDVCSDLGGIINEIFKNFYSLG